MFTWEEKVDEDRTGTEARVFINWKEMKWLNI